MPLYDYRRVIASERASWALLHRVRWPDGPRCPHCDTRRPWRMHHRGRPAYRCRTCRAHFNALTGTALADTRLPLSKWVLAIGLFKVGISSRALAEELCVSPHTAWQLLHRLRRAVQHVDWLQQLQGQIEVDDTYVGGKRKGPRGRGARHKTLVIGLKERGGRVRSLAITALTQTTIHAILRAHVAQGARVYTDEFAAYGRLHSLGLRHRRIKHVARFVRGQTHTQGIEGHWGHLKPTLVARHRSVAPHHLQKYLAEADVKHNFPPDRDFIAFMLTQLTTCERSLPHY
jgi:transposase-like protein